MIKPREKTPEVHINLVNDTEWTLSKQTPNNFTLLIFYRGIHCPVCKTYLETLKTKLETFKELGVNVIAISSDTEAIAKKTYEEWDIEALPVAYGFPIDKAREWGLFISEGIKKEPEIFIEPGLFLIKPNQELYCASVQTMPFARPRLDDLIDAIKFIKKNDYPARGEA